MQVTGNTLYSFVSPDCLRFEMFPKKKHHRSPRVQNHVALTTDGGPTIVSTLWLSVVPNLWNNWTKAK